MSTQEESKTIQLGEIGDAISSHGSAAVYELRVETGDPMAQIVVLDDRFDAVIKAAGAITQELPAGIYKIRVQRGASSIGFTDKVVVLDRDVRVLIEPPQLSSPAPLGGTSASGAHMAASEWLDAVVHESAGEGSKIAVLARYAAPQQGPRPLLDPFRGLQLLRANGDLLVDLEKAAPKVHVPDTRDPISVCGIRVDPGAYILRHRLSSGRQISQSVIASADWQITVSIRRPQVDGSAGEMLPAPSKSPHVESGKELFDWPGYVSLLMRRLVDGKSAQPASRRTSGEGLIDDDQLVEVARQGLADGAQLLSGNLYDLLLREFENPLAGIVGGLLLDLEREVAGAGFSSEHASLFDVVVSRLRKMVGRDHPDVEALSFRCQNPSLVHRGAIESRPMFHRSWRVILEAAARRQKLVPFDLWRRTSASGSMPPYLIWTADPAHKQAHLQRIMKTASDLSAVRIVSIQPSGLGEPFAAPTKVASAGLKPPGSPTTDAFITVGPSSVAGFGMAPMAMSTASSAARPRTKRLSRYQIALEMGVPANALSQLIEGSTFDASLLQSKLGLLEEKLG